MAGLGIRSAWIRRLASHPPSHFHIQSQSSLLRLPTELLLSITEFLPREVWLCLALTCKALWNMLIDGPIRPAMKGAELNCLLWLLEVDSPRYMSCFACQRLHPMEKLYSYTIATKEYLLGTSIYPSHENRNTRDNRLSSTENIPLKFTSSHGNIENILKTPSHHLLSSKCEAATGTLRIGYRNVVPFRTIHLIMRSWRISPGDGIPASALAHRWTKKDEQYSEKYGQERQIHPQQPESVEVSPKFVEERLFLMFDYVFRINFSQGDPTHRAGVGHPGCPHKYRHELIPVMDTSLEWVCKTKVYHARLCFLEYGEPIRPCPCMHCRLNYRCRRCTTEWKPFISDFSDAGCTLTLRVWKDVGSAAHPLSPLWFFNREESAANGDSMYAVWKHSFMSETLQGIYEKGFSNSSKSHDEFHIYL